jgi:hypothetical protein
MKDLQALANPPVDFSKVMKIYQKRKNFYLKSFLYIQNIFLLIF